MRGSHEDRDERTACRRARKRVGADAEPAGVVVRSFVDPELFFLEQLVLDDKG
jgi:hypothetical protein